ncbi:response regulator [soil metagenome]
MSRSPGEERAGINSTSPAGSDGPTILVAEDHADSREALRALLEATGYKVRVAVNGREAIDAAVAAPPDLILMDLMMPEVDGFHATRTLRAREEFREVPILALTAMEGSRELALAAGCDDYMPKPIDVRTFLSKVARWLEDGRTTSS